MPGTPVLSQTQRLLGALVTAAAVTLPLIASGDSEGTVVAKIDQGSMTMPVRQPAQ
jgi:hypothetical protein